jgi:hypothetical protein
MRVEYSNTAEDLVKASAIKYPSPTAADRQNHRTSACIGILFIVGAVVMVPASAFLGLHHDGFWWIAGISVVGLVGTVLYQFLVARSTRGLRRRFAANPKNAEPVALEIDDDGIQFQTRLWRCRVPWAAVRSFFETQTLLIFIDDFPETFLIPKRAFADETMRNQFCQTVRDRIAATR